MVRRPSGFGVTVAVSDHSPPAPVELTAKATPPSCGRVRLEIDVLESPALAVALIVDDERAVLQSDLGERAAVEAERVEAIDPGEQRRERIGRDLDRRQATGRRTLAATAAAIELVIGRRDRRGGLAARRRGD